MKKQATQQDMILKIKEDNVTMANKHFFSECINRLAACAVALQIYL